MTLNGNHQFYGKIQLTQSIKRNYTGMKARRFYLFNTKQAIWIPCSYLEKDGTIKEKANLDWIFKKKDVLKKIDLAKT